MKDFNLMAPWGNMVRCIVNPDHTVEAFLDPDNSNYYADGTEVDWQEVEDKGQNVMVQIPKFYFSKKKVGEDFYFGASNEPIETDYIKAEEWEIHPAFYRDRTAFVDDLNANPVEVDYRYVGAFLGWVDDKGRLRSLPNKTPTVEKNIGRFRNHAKNMGAGWTQFDFNLMYALQMLYITEYGHPDSQTHIGRGYVDGNSSRTKTGGTLIHGNKTFGEETGKVQMSYRGVEDFYGNVSPFVDGFVLSKPASGDLSISNKGFNNNGNDYERIARTPDFSNLNIRNIRPEKELGFLPIETSGSNEKDGLYDHGFLYRSSATRFASFGGSWNLESRAGAFYFHSDLLGSQSNSSVGARLCL